MHAHTRIYIYGRGPQSKHKITSVPYFLMDSLKTTPCTIPNKSVHTLSCILCRHV